MEIDQNKINSEIYKSFWHLFNLYRKYSSKVSKNLNDADLIHDLRVTLRRLQSLLELLKVFETNEDLGNLVETIKKVFKKFNRMRDIQVQIALAREMKIYELHRISYLTFLEKKENSEERKLKLIHSGILIQIEGDLFFTYLNLKNNKFKSFEYKFEELIKYGKQKYTNLLYQCSTIQKNNYSSYHPVRLALKKFRYLMEIFQPILNFSNERLNDLQLIQSTLGLIQDHCVFQNLVREYLSLIKMKESEISNVFDKSNNRLKELELNFEQKLIKLNFWDAYFK